MGSLALGVSRRPLRSQKQWGAHVQSWAQVEAGGNPGQHVEAALEVQVVSGLGEELTRFLVLTLKDMKKKKIYQFMLYALQSVISSPHCR